MNKTTTVWLLHLSRPETFVWGPYKSEADAIEAGGGRVELPHPKRAADVIQVQEGLVSQMENVPTVSLREEFAYWLGIGVVLMKTKQERYTDEELDRRHPCLVEINKRLAAQGRRLVFC
jgi:hypothetical protein